jgi:ABC-type spermidine/putrescine transport system permease subunit I
MARSQTLGHRRCGGFPTCCIAAESVPVAAAGAAAAVVRRDLPGSLLVLLWQGFYTFDDFTMAVTPDLTLANFAALFQPSNFDIILRTLSMAIVVSIASAIVAFPIAYYMARYTTGKTKAFFYIAVMMPMWASYIVKAYAWTLLLAKGGVAQWFVQHLGWSRCCSSCWAFPASAAAPCRPRTWGASWCLSISGCRS